MAATIFGTIFYNKNFTAVQKGSETKQKVNRKIIVHYLHLGFTI